jgi:hypothetical protein
MNYIWIGTSAIAECTLEDITVVLYPPFTGTSIYIYIVYEHKGASFTQQGTTHYLLWRYFWLPLRNMILVVNTNYYQAYCLITVNAGYKVTGV